MISKEAVIAEIQRLELPIDDLPEHELKALIVSARMKSVYEPLTDAVTKSYETIRKHLKVQQQSP